MRPYFYRIVQSHNARSTARNLLWSRYDLGQDLHLSVPLEEQQIQCSLEFCRNRSGIATRLGNQMVFQPGETTPEHQSRNTCCDKNTSLKPCLPLDMARQND